MGIQRSQGAQSSCRGKKKAERKCICIHTHEPSPQELRPKNEQKKEEKKAEENIRYVCVYVSSGQGSRLNSRRPSGKKRKKKVGKRKNKEKKADWGGAGYRLQSPLVALREGSKK